MEISFRTSKLKKQIYIELKGTIKVKITTKKGVLFSKSMDDVLYVLYLMIDTFSLASTLTMDKTTFSGKIDGKLLFNFKIRVSLGVIHFGL